MIIMIIMNRKRETHNKGNNSCRHNCHSYYRSCSCSRIIHMHIHRQSKTIDRLYFNI